MNARRAAPLDAAAAAARQSLRTPMKTLAIVFASAVFPA